MPIFTTLEFFRTEQTISSFDKVYPKSFEGLREAILGSLETVKNMVVQVSHQYLNGYQSHESYIREKAISLQLLLIETRTEGIYRQLDFDILLDEVESSNFLHEHVNNIKDINKNVTDFNPDAFTPIVELFERILRCMEKYFLSFYFGNTDNCPSRFVETPFNYENKRLRIVQNIKNKMRKIYTLSNQFNTRGVRMKDLGNKSNHLARISKSTEMPFFLLFPESCYLVEDSRRLLMQWIESDKEYPILIHLDMDNMKEEKNELEIKRRISYDEYIKSRYITEKMQKEYDKMISLKPLMHAKLEESKTEDDETLVKMRLNELQTERASNKIKELQSKTEDDNTLNREINENMSIIHKNTELMKEYKMKLDRIESKIKWYKNFKKTLASKKEELDITVKNFSENKKKFENLDSEIATLNAYTDYLHSICALKSSHSTLKKIFHRLDFKHKIRLLPDRDHGSQAYKTDELSEAIQITSQAIGKDWIKLYTRLPFHPPRGSAEVDGDIERITKSQVRGLREDLAFQSLNSWRRFHIRANKISLVEALQNINRFDILRKLNCLPKYKENDSLNRIEEEKLPPISATTRFLIKHYPNLQNTVQTSQ